MCKCQTFNYKQTLLHGLQLDDSSEQNKETWIIFKTLRGHLEDVTDLSWSLDSTQMVSSEIGCMAIVWDVMKAKSKLMLTDHKNFVQGVAWDPKNKFIATISTDRYESGYSLKIAFICCSLC